MAMVPDERKLAERMVGKPFALIGVNSDKDPAKVKEVVAREKITWPSFRDGRISGRIATDWKVDSWPTIYLLDRKGVIRYRNVRDQALADAVDALSADVGDLCREIAAALQKLPIPRQPPSAKKGA